MFLYYCCCSLWLWKSVWKVSHLTGFGSQRDRLNVHKVFRLHLVVYVFDNEITWYSRCIFVFISLVDVWLSDALFNLAPWLGEVIGSRAHNKSLNSAFSPFLCQMGGVYRLVGQQKAKGMWVGEKITWVDVRFVQLACQGSVANSWIDVQELTFYFGPYLVALWGLKERERDPFWGPLFVVLERS